MPLTDVQSLSNEISLKAKHFIKEQSFISFFFNIKSNFFVSVDFQFIYQPSDIS